MSPRSIRVPALGAALVMAVALGACGDSADPTITAAPPLTAPGTTIAPTTTAPPVTATTLPPATTTPPTAPPPVDTNSLASGSGCTPGSGPLPDGYWFGYVGLTDTATLEFDLACWFSGEAAALAAAEDAEESPPPNDYHIRNASSSVRTLAVDVGSDGQDVAWYRNPGDPNTAEVISYSDWIANRETRGYQPGIWITVAGGNVTSIDEQYVP